MKQIIGIIAVVLIATACADGIPNHIQQQLNETAEREYEHGHRSGAPSTAGQNGFRSVDNILHQQGCEWAIPEIEAAADRYLNYGTLTQAETQQAIRNALEHLGCN